MASCRALAMRAGGRAAAQVPARGLPVATGSWSRSRLHGCHGHPQLVVSLWARGPVAVGTGSTATHCDAASPGDEMLILLGAIRSQAATSRGIPALPSTSSLPTGSAVPSHGGSRLWWAAAPCALPLRFPAAPGADKQPPGWMAECGRSRSLLWAGGWLPSLAATPPGWGRLSHPTCAARQRREAGRDAWSSALRAGACFSPSPPAPSAARLWVTPRPWDTVGLAPSQRPPLRAASVGIAELLLVGLRASLPSLGHLGTCCWRSHPL